MTVTVSVDLVADCVVDPADPVDLADLVDLAVDPIHPVDLCVDLYLALGSVEAFLLFTISVLCVECLDFCLGSTFDHCVGVVFCIVKCLDDLCLCFLSGNLCLGSSSDRFVPCY